MKNRKPKKKREQYPLVILLFLSTVLFQLLAVAGKKGVLSAYSYDYAKAPLLSLTFRAFADGITPSELVRYEEAAAVQTTSAPPLETQTAATLPLETQTAASLPPETQEAASLPLTMQDTNPPAGTGAADTGTDPGNAAQDTTQTEPAAVAPPAFPKPTGAAAQDAYYADALFIGDSRTVGLSQYVPALDAQATFYCKTSMTIFNALETECAPIDGQMLPIDRALQYRRFGKVYIMLGINEIGSDINRFISTYKNVLNRITELQPDAAIYVQGIMHVSDKKQKAQPLYSNTAVNARNERLKTLCDNVRIFYIDTNYLLDDANGALSAEHTFDGAHLNGGSYELWYQMIKAQTR